MELTYTLNEIDQVADRLIKEFKSDVILFNASMGSGKTTLIKAICKRLGVVQEITSPTFSLVNEYEGNSKTVFHFDLYRIENDDQLFDIGFEDYLDNDAYLFIEWPKRALSYLTDFQTIDIKILDQSTRTLKLT